MHRPSYRPIQMSQCLVFCLLVELFEQISQHATNGPAAAEVQETPIPPYRANYEPAHDVLNCATFAPPNSGGQELENIDVTSLT